MNRRQSLGALGALATGGLVACASTASRAPILVPEGLQAGAQKPFQIEGQALGRMWVSLPEGYAQASEPWPLLVFLHGSGECGSDLEAVLRNGPPKHAAMGRRYPLVLVSPQQPEERDWDPTQLHALMLGLQQRFYVDPRRTLATGLSLGGHGVWNWGSTYPGDLAAAAPVCGYGDPSKVAAMRKVPVRAYHGDADDVVPVAEQQACVDALRRAGGQVTFTVYPGVNHGSWIPAYDDPGLLPWLLAQRQAT